MRWDLDGLGDKKLLESFRYLTPLNRERFIYFYIIGNLYYSTDLYKRSCAMCLPYSFTTNELIYELTGISNISLNTYVREKVEINDYRNRLLNLSHSDCLNLMAVYGEDENDIDITSSYLSDLSVSDFSLSAINTINLEGNSDMLSYFSASLPFLSKSCIYFTVLEAGLNESITLIDTLHENVFIDDYDSILSSGHVSFTISESEFLSDNKALFRLYELILLNRITKKYPFMRINSLSLKTCFMETPFLLSYFLKIFDIVYISISPYEPYGYLIEILNQYKNIKVEIPTDLNSKEYEKMRSIFKNYM